MSKSPSVNIAQLTALLGSFVFGVAFTFLSAWPRREPAPEQPEVTWPALLDAEARLGIATQLAARPDARRLAMLRKARTEESDPRILAVLDGALGPVIGEPE